MIRFGLAIAFFSSLPMSFRWLGILACLSTLFLAAPLHGWEAKVRGSAFFPSSHLFREIYHTPMGNFDVEIAADVFSHLQVWGNFDYTEKNGRSIPYRNPTTLRIVNGSFGIKVPFCIGRWAAYAGIGPTFGSIRIKDNSQFTGRSICSKSAVGFVAKSGIDYYFTKCAFVDIFCDYVYQKAHFQKHVDVSGLRVGGGIGYSF